MLKIKIISSLVSVTAILFLSDCKNIKQKEPSMSVIAQNCEVPVETSKTVKLPVFTKGEQMLLTVTTRCNSDEFGGWNYVVQYLVNGKPVNALLNRKSKILMNHELSFLRNNIGTRHFWNTGDGIWLAVFSPNFEDLQRTHGGIGEKDPYTYVLDITPLLFSERENTFTIKNLATASMRKSYIDYTLVTHVNASVGPMPGKLSSGKKESVSLQPPFSLFVSPEGMFAVMAGETKLPFRSAFAQPGGGWNYLSSAGEKSASGDWHPEIRNVSGNTWQINASAGSYAVQRTITLNGNRFDIEDNITNKSNEDIAVRFFNEWLFNSDYVPTCMIGGNPNQSLNNISSPENPTMFFPLKESGLGITVNDDVYRNHAVFYYNDNRAAGMKDDSFALAAGKSYKIAWSIYAVASDDYYDFINQVRKDWGANYTLQGPIYWTTYEPMAVMSGNEIRSLIGDFNAKYIAFWEMNTKEPIPGWAGLIARGYGSVILTPIFEAELGKVRQAVSNLHAVCPGIKVSPYSHCFFQGLERPDDETFKDCWVTDSSDKRCISAYNYIKGYVNYQPVFPTLNNSFGREYRRIIDMYVNVIGIDWLYWDEINGPGTTAGDNSSAANSTYIIWDGHSADIDDKTNRILKKYAILPLICDDFIVSIANIFRDKGSFVLLNGPACTKQRIGYPCMAEANIFSHVYTLHLCSPLAYTTANPSVACIRKFLDAGVLLIKNKLTREAGGSMALTKCYPLTPMEIRPGLIKGAERIITSKSGRFGWAGQFNARVYKFDKDGKLEAENPPTNEYENAFDLQVPDEGLVVIERIY